MSYKTKQAVSMNLGLFFVLYLSFCKPWVGNLNFCLEFTLFNTAIACYMALKSICDYLNQNLKSWTSL